MNFFFFFGAWSRRIENKELEDGWRTFLCVVDSEGVPSFPPKDKSHRSI